MYVGGTVALINCTHISAKIIIELVRIFRCHHLCCSQIFEIICELSTNSYLIIFVFLDHNFVISLVELSVDYIFVPSVSYNLYVIYSYNLTPLVIWHTTFYITALVYTNGILYRSYLPKYLPIFLFCSAFIL